MSNDYYPDDRAGHDALVDRLDVLVRMLDAASALHTAARFPILKPDTHGYDLKGKRYIRVFRDSSNGQRFVDFFVERETGDVWKAAGWKAPARNFVRGNINTPEGRWALTGGKISESGYFYPGF